MAYTKWIGGAVGWALGGPVGGILGYWLGKMVADDSLGLEGGAAGGANARGRRTTHAGDFALSMVVLSAAVMQADQRVLKSELAYVKGFFKTNFGQAQAEQQFAQTHAERLDAVQSEFADFMESLQSDVAQRQPLFQPLRDLALALAEHLARVELSLSDAAIDAVINTVINSLDPSDLGQIEIHVSEAWAERLKGQPLQGFAEGYPVITAEGLSDGDVRLVVNNAQVEDLIAERIEQLAQQMNNADFTDVAEAAAVAEMENESAEPTAAAALEDSVDGNRASLDADDAVFEELPAVDPESDEE